jgi:hypothetical protein
MKQGRFFCGLVAVRRRQEGRTARFCRMYGQSNSTQAGSRCGWLPLGLHGEQRRHMTHMCLLRLTLGSPCAASVVRSRSNGYEAMVAAAPATAPLVKDTQGLGPAAPPRAPNHASVRDPQWHLYRHMLTCTTATGCRVVCLGVFHTWALMGLHMQGTAWLSPTCKAPGCCCLLALLQRHKLHGCVWHRKQESGDGASPQTLQQSERPCPSHTYCC